MSKTWTLSDSSSGERVWEAIPVPNILECEVVKVEEREKPEWAIRDPEVTTEISFRFRVISGDYEKRNLWGNAAPFFNFSPKCRLRLWVQAILGVDELPEGYQLNLEELAGKRCRVTVGNRTNKDDVVKDFAQDVYPAAKAVNTEEEPF